MGRPEFSVLYFIERVEPETLVRLLVYQRFEDDATLRRRLLRIA